MHKQLKWICTMKIEKSPVFVSLLFWLANQCLLMEGCPQQCICTALSQSYDVSCHGVFTAIPTGFPGSTERLVIKGDTSRLSSVSSITKADVYYVGLNVLLLTGLKIKTINADTFSSSSAILKLDLHDNEISKLPVNVFSALKKLIFLDLSNNKISSIAETQLSDMSLTLLNLRKNRITVLKYEHFQSISHSLQHVDLSENNLASLDSRLFEGHNLLRNIKVNKCGLKRIDKGFLENIKSVTAIEIRDNFITEISSDLFNVTRKIAEIHLDGNQLEILSSGTFSGLNLRILGLSRNRISFIDPLVFSDFTVTNLRLSDNNLTKLADSQFSFLNQSLRLLSLGGNPLGVVTKAMLPYLPKLNALDLSRASLSNFPHDIIANHEIELLNISNNNFKHLRDLTLNALKKVDLVDLFGNNWNCNCFVKPLRSWLITSNYSQDCNTNLPVLASEKSILKHRPLFNCLKCGSDPKINRQKFIVNLTAAELEQCNYSDEWFTIDRQVLILAGSSCILIFFGFTIFFVLKRMVDRKNYNLAKSKTTSKHQATVTTISDGVDGSSTNKRTGVPILASFEDLSGERVFVNAAFRNSIHDPVSVGHV